ACSFFFFPSRRRHTRFSRDWSSDVCSSDLLSEKLQESDKSLVDAIQLAERETGGKALAAEILTDSSLLRQFGDGQSRDIRRPGRSEERRVGKECRARWSTEDDKEK